MSSFITFCKILHFNTLCNDVDKHVSVFRPKNSSIINLCKYWSREGSRCYQGFRVLTTMHRSAIFQAPPNAVDFLWSGKGLWRGLFCVFYVRFAPDNIILIYWIKIDHVLLQMIMIDSWGYVHAPSPSAMLLLIYYYKIALFSRNTQNCSVKGTCLNTWFV